MFEKEELDNFIKETSKNTDVNLEGDILGDIVISIPKVYEQAEEYGHSFERELAYMVVHGFYHLMGYDHIEESDKIKMREKEEKVLQHLLYNLIFFMTSLITQISSNESIIFFKSSY